MMKVETVTPDELVCWRICADFSRRHKNRVQLERALEPR